MTQTATFTVVTPAGEVVQTYSMEYSDAKHLNALYQEAREVWAEYFVVAETPFFELTNSHTYKEELDWEMDKLQWEYMNGEYPEE